MLTRRRLLALLPPALAALHRSASAQFHFPRKTKTPPAPTFVYFGTDTLKPGARGIYRSRFDAKTGHLTPPDLIAENPRAVFMAVNQVGARKLIYVTNEGDTAANSTMSSYEMNLATGALTGIGQVPSGGAGPCFVAVDATGQSAFVANYAGGSIASFHVLPDGRLTAPVDRVDFRAGPTQDARFGDHRPTPGPRHDRQDGAHPHSAMVSPDNGFVLVNDLGQDAIAIFPFNPTTARLSAPTVVQNRIPGSGPRHLAFHPNGRWVYGVDELANRVDQYLWTIAHAVPGRPAQAILSDTAHPVSTVAEGLEGTNTAAEIMIETTGRFVYVSNRGMENSLVVFAVDQSLGTLTLIQRIDCGGKGPRQFTFDPSQRWLVCGNQNSDSVTVFARSPVDGRLSGPVQTVPLVSPMYTLFA